MILNLPPDPNPPPPWGGIIFWRNWGYNMLQEDRKTKWYLRPIIVVLLLFFVLGPFGLPLVYKSPKFSKTLKIILTIVVIIYTCYLIFVSLEIGREVYMRMEQLQEQLR